MSARCVFTLLVVVVLSLLLASGSALSRPGPGRDDALEFLGIIDGEGSGDPDNTDPGGGYMPGDDDVWDKPVPGSIDSKTAGLPGVGGRTQVAFSSDRPSERSARMAVWLQLLLRNWIFFIGVR